VPGDQWIEVPDLDTAAAALGREPKCVFLTVGRLGLAAFEAAPQHHYIVRSIDPPDELNLPDHRLLLERGPFDEASQAELMAAEHVDIMVTKNAGGEATYGKVAAARHLGLPVIMVQPPTPPDVPTFHELDDVMAEIDRHGASLLADRGV
jgi:precorrin-6A/cobalt-precorrin-6A reductase